jgi:translation initiation factor 3 subunit D
LEYYDKTYDRLSTKAPKKLVRTKRDCHTVTTSDDSIIREVIRFFLSKGDVDTKKSFFFFS